MSVFEDGRRSWKKADLNLKLNKSVFLQVVFGYIYGILVFHDAHNVLGILGSFVICAGVIAVSWPQKKTDPLPQELGKSDLEDSAILEMAPLVEHAGPTSKGWESP